MQPDGVDDGAALTVRWEPLLARLLYRRDAWGLPFAWDVPPCAPEVALASDRDEQRVRHARLLAEVWRRATTEHWREAADIPLVGPVELRALGMMHDDAGPQPIDQWIAERHTEFVALSSLGARSDPGWRLWESLACERASVTAVSVLPVMGEWMRVHHGVLQASLALYADPERFVDAAMAD